MRHAVWFLLVGLCAGACGGDDQAVQARSPAPDAGEAPGVPANVILEDAATAPSAAPQSAAGEVAVDDASTNPTTVDAAMAEPSDAALSGNPAPVGGNTPSSVAPIEQSVAGGCYSLRHVSAEAAAASWLSTSASGDAFSFSGNAPGAAKFFLKAADLGTYLLYDQDGGYLTTEGSGLERRALLRSDVTEIDDAFVSPALWEFVPVPSAAESATFQLRHLRTGNWLASTGLVQDVAGSTVVVLEETNGCRTHPELSLDASGTVQSRTFSDGALFGIADTHSHLLTNFAFGGGGIFHGSAFHPLGVEHALSDCERYHGTNGRADILGAGNSDRGAGIETVLPALLLGELPSNDHNTRGYPDFVDWPNGPTSATHQTQYYLWLQRAWMAGLRLVVQHATSNEAICKLVVGRDFQRVRYDCNDMLAVDRILSETRAMERYIDAQAGGEGRGFFRIVETPAAAREVIAAGKMAVVLGIETSNLFDCFLVPRSGFPTCDADYVRTQLDKYQAQGVRVLFPVHKYDNAFSAGDGDRNVIELGNWINSGHWSNFVQEGCPDVPAVFDRGPISLGGLNRPRDDYMSSPPVNMSRFEDRPLLTLAPHVLRLQQGSRGGDYCQNHGLTELGETLMLEMMRRGMVIEVDHFSRRSYERAFELLTENDYPAAASHGSRFEGRLYAHGGVSKTNLGRCRDPERPSATLDELKERIAAIRAEGGYPAEGFGFDFNGFASVPGPRFGEGRCAAPQSDPVTYPFTSYAGDVTFTEPKVGNRVLDFNTEGMVHVGLLPELLDDARRDAASDAELEPLFRSAEGYIRMWERAEQRGAELSSR